MQDTNTNPAGTISCLLCRARISVSCGLDGDVGQSLAKLRAHLTFDHEAHFDQDMLIAIAFLEEGEKDVIVENVIPRIKRTVETVRPNVTTGKIERKLKELLVKDTVDTLDEKETMGRKRKKCTSNAENGNTNADGSIKVTKKVKVQSKSILNSNTENSDDVNNIDVKHTINGLGEEEFLQNNIIELTHSPIVQDVDYCDVCHNFIEVSEFEDHEKSHKSDLYNGNEDLTKESSSEEDLAPGDDLNDPKKVKCSLCESTMLRSNLRRHQRRVHGINPNDDDTELACEASSLECIKLEISPEEDISNDNKLTCDICNSTMLKRSLNRHMKNIHGISPQRQHCD